MGRDEAMRARARVWQGDGIDTTLPNVSITCSVCGVLSSCVAADQLTAWTGGMARWRRRGHRIVIE